MIKKIIFYAVFALVISVVSIFITQNKMKSAKPISKSSLILYDVHNLMDVLNYFSRKDAPADFVREPRKTIEAIVITKMLVVSALKPDIGKLQGVDLEALMQVVEYMKSPGFNSSVNENEAAKMALSYIKNIEPKVIAQSKSPRNILKESERERLGLPKRQQNEK